MPKSDEQQTLVILFADITGSTGLYEKFGDVATQKLVADCLAILIAKTEECGGSLIQTVGDEVMTRFPNADSAFRAAVAMQQAHINAPVSIRVGFHYGSVIQKGINYFGNAVNIAARMANWATAGEIMTTGDTVDRLSPAFKSGVRHLDTTTVKGKDEMIAIFEVIWREDDEDSQTIMGGDTTAPPAAGEIILELSHDGANYRLGAGRPTVTIGRDEGNDMVVNDSLASRKHAKIQFTRGKFLLTDYSSNGTYVEMTDKVSTMLKRETSEIVGSGVISLGRPHLEGSAGIIRFRRLDQI